MILFIAHTKNAIKTFSFVLITMVLFTKNFCQREDFSYEGRDKKMKS